MLTRGGAVLLALTGAAALALSTAVPLPLREGDTIDPRTGRTRPTVWTQLRNALRSGDARHGLAHLRLRMREQPDQDLFRRVAGLLGRELQPPSFRPLDAHRALLLSDAPAPEEVHAVLTASFADDTGARVEALFRDVADGDGVDARAARVLRELRHGRQPGLATLQRLADAFAATGRSRAQLRWLLRAYARHPENTESLSGVYLANSRLHEAFALTTGRATRGEGDEAFWRRRAQLAAWLSQTVAEASALERVLGFGEDLTARRRLVDIYAYLGEAERGVPHARVLAQKAGELAAADEAVLRSFATGQPDRGLRLLEQLAEQTGDSSTWRARAAEYALQDLQVGRAEAYLRKLVAEDPEGGHAHRLAELYRRRDRPEDLADLLELRARRVPEDRALWDEAIALRHGLGEHGRARELEGERDIALLDPERYRQQLGPDERAELVELRRRAMSLMLSDDPSSGIVGQVLLELRPYLDRPGFRSVAEALLRRFPNDPQARALRIELLDRGRTPTEAAHAAAELAATYPGDVELTRLWVERTAWADLVDEQVRARTVLLRLDPEDADNRRELADLYEFRGEHRAALSQWRWLAAGGGLGSDTVPRLIESLFACGEEDEAVQWLERLAGAPDATVANKLAAAEQLFFTKSYDQAQVLYRAVLAEDPAQPRALLRIGQILSWTNDPRGAVPFLRRRLDAVPADADPERAIVSYQLGEALWVLGEDGEARALHEAALAAMQRVDDEDIDRRSRVATMLARLDRRAEARPLYRALIAASPRNLDLVLDFADVLVADGDHAQAEALMRHAAGVEPDHPRLLRAQGQLLLQLGDHAGADAALARALEVHGPDAGLLADRGHAQERAGDWEGALVSYRRWSTLQAESVAARRAAAEMGDRLAHTGVLSFRLLDVGKDRTYEAAVEGRVRLDSDHSWLKGRAGYGRYEGRAAAFQNGTADLVTDVGLFDLAYERRFRGADHWSAGAGIAAGAPGDVDVSGWLGLFLQRAEPYATLELRLFGNELLTQPAAAVGLAGRAHGFEAHGYGELGGRFWAGGSVELSALHVDPDGAAAATDGHFAGELSLGYRVHEGDIAVPDRFRIRRTPSGPSVLFLQAEPEQTRDLMVNAWAAFQSYRLLDDQDLAAMLPIADHAEYVVGAARVDKHVAHGFGVALEGYFGGELAESSSIWGVDLSLHWRPEPEWEITLAGGRGAVLGRTGDDDDSHHVRFQAVMRW